MAQLTVLEREMYSEVEAARLLQVPRSTLHYWLEGGERRGRVYEPILRPVATGSRTVTWGEFVEATLLREYRRTEFVPMAEIRDFIEHMRIKRGVPYPLADRSPFTGEGPRLLEEVQEETNLPGDLRLVTWSGGQLVLLPAADSFVHRVVWVGDQAEAWRPHADPKSPVRVHPGVRFGQPAVGGISTSVLSEQLTAGATVAEVAEDFDLEPDLVEWARAYEVSVRTPAKAA
jgi:uncharacterized protein (DUF433 family)